MGRGFLAVQLSTDPEELSGVDQLSFVCDDCGIAEWTVVSMERELLPQPTSRRFTSEAEEARLREGQIHGISSILLFIRFVRVRDSYKLYYKVRGKTAYRRARPS